MNTTLRTHRERRGFTQEALAKQIGVAPRTYRNYERGTQLPNIAVGYLLEQILKTPVEVLFNLTAPTSTTERIPR